MRMLKKGALILGSVGVTLGVIEIALRLAGYNPVSTLFQPNGRFAPLVRESADPQRIYELRPATSGRGWDTDVSVNFHGFRGPAISPQKRANLFRIAVLGDSVSFANYLPEDAAFPRLLESQLLASGRNVEVVNLSVPGYNTLQEVSTLRDIGVQFSPDLVVLAYCINDLGISSGVLEYISRLRKYRGSIYKSRVAQFVRVQLDRLEQMGYFNDPNSPENLLLSNPKWSEDVSSDSELLRLIESLRDHTIRHPQLHPFVQLHADPKAVARFRFALTTLQRLSDQFKFDVIVVIVPLLRETPEERPGHELAYGIVRHETTRAGFSLINLHETFATEGFAKFELRSGDPLHPNSYGHALIAKRLRYAVQEWLSVRHGAESTPAH